MDKIFGFILSLLVAFLSMYLWQVMRVPGSEDFVLDGDDAPEYMEDMEEPQIIQVSWLVGW